MKIKDIFKKKKYLQRLCYCKNCDAVWYKKTSKCPECGRAVDGMTLASSGSFSVDNILSLKKMVNENP